MLADVLIILFAVIALILLDVTALRYGHDSRDKVRGER